MPSLRHEFRYAVRSLRRSPLASCFIVATLAVCIGAVAAVYSVADVVLVRALPFERPEQLVWVSSVTPQRADGPFTLPEFLDYRAQVPSVRLGGYAIWNAILERPAGAVRVQGLRMSADALELLGVSPGRGRLLAGADDDAGAPRVVVLGDAYWRQAFAADPGVLGRFLTLNGLPHRIVGVLPRYCPLPVRDVDLVVPLDPAGDPRRNARGSVNFIRIFGRLAPGAGVARAEGDLNTVRSRLRSAYPAEYAAKIGVHLTPLRDYLAATLKPTLVLLLVCIGLMLAVALANVLHLLLARALARQGETAVRMALGATRTRLALRLLCEGVVLVAAAGALGTLLAHTAIAYGAAHLGTLVPRIEEARLNLSVLGLVCGVCALAVLLFSLVPMLVARHVPIDAVLRGAGRGGTPARTEARLHAAFVVAEVALALVITAATAAVVQGLAQMERVPLGFRPDSVFVARLSLPPKRYPAPADLSRFSAAMTAALAREPGVTVAGGSSIAPLSGVFATVPVAPAQHPPADRREWPSAWYRAVSPGYLEAIGARRIAWRLFAEADDDTAPPVAVINRTMAARCFAPTGAVGRELLLDDNDTGPRPVSVVGVVDDLREADLDGPLKPEVFIAMRQVHPDALTLVTGTQFWAVRLREEPLAFRARFEAIVRRIDPAVATSAPTDLRAFVAAALAPRRFSVGLLVAFTLVSLLLAMLGVYGVAAYTVERRRREIGIRMALGATPLGILGLVLGRTLRLAGLGTAVGILGAWLANGVLSRLLFGASAVHPGLLAIVSAILLLTAIVASALPGWRASRVDVLRALSAE